jgi:thiamine pyrophosphokinase
VRALIVADGAPPPKDELDAAWPGWANDVGLVVAADGGARVADSLGLRPDLVVGDGDSLGPDGVAALQADGVEIRIVRADKDESDTELAILAAIERGATAITVVAAFGGRLDHTLANIWLLALPALADRPAELLDATTRVTLISAPRGIPVRRVLAGGRPGDLVSLLPLDTAVVGITTERLRYPLRNETLLVGPSRGLSNVRLEADAAVTVRLGRLLVVETPAALATLGR